MKLLDIRYNKIITILFFSIIFFLGIFVFRDYGNTIDDEIYFQNGIYIFSYIKLFFQNWGISFEDAASQFNLINDYGSGTDPAIFEVLVIFIKNLLNLKESKEIYELSHFLNFLIFFISLCFFYIIIKNRFKSYKYALLGVIFLFISPRIFADSFYNSRDIFFLSITILNCYSAFLFIQRSNFRNAFLFSLTTGLVIDAKIIGILFPIILVFFLILKSLDNLSFFKKNYKYFIFIIFFSLTFVILFSPYLWSDPINNILFVFTDLFEKQSTLSVPTLYLGKYISATETPWHYRLLWFLITTPVIIIFLFMIGIFFQLKRTIKRFINLDEKRNTDVWKSNNEIIDIYFLLIIFLSFLLTIIFQDSQYNGWRHLYYIYPSVIMISLFGYYNLALFIKKFNIKFLLSLLIFLNFSYVIYWNIKYHPFQNVYFNILSKKYINNNFDLDYWGLSNKQSIEFIIKNSNSLPVTVITNSLTSLEVASKMLTEKEKKNILIKHQYDKADFIITNYMKKIRKNFIIDENKYRKYYEIVVDGIPISTVYKKL